MTYSLKLDSTTESYINIKLFRNVQNVRDLRKRLLAGELHCCIINPKFILDPFQIVIAANKALTAENITTKTIFTEILFNLSISKNISKSLVKFGIDERCKDLLVVTVDKIQSNSEVFDEINGEEVDLSVLKHLQDLKAIKQAYNIEDDVEGKETSLLDSVISRIVTKDFVSH